jgi:hypothetical protein
LLAAALADDCSILTSSPAKGFVPAEAGELSIKAARTVKERSLFISFSYKEFNFILYYVSDK